MNKFLNQYPTTLLKKIIDNHEKEDLIQWINANKDSVKFKWSVHPGTIRRTTRVSKQVLYPKVCFEIRNRIQKKLNISSNLYPDFPQGMVASVGFHNDQCGIHKDPIWFENTITYHCVVLLSKPDYGGIPIIDKKLFDMEETDGLFYPVSEVEHGTTKLVGNKTRMLWIFGFCIPI